MKSTIIKPLLILLFFLSGVKTFAQSCGDVIQPYISCDKGMYIMHFSITNNTSWSIKGVTIAPNDPNITAVSTESNGGNPFFDIADIGPGSTSTVLNIPMYITKYSTTACFSFTFCNQDTVIIPPPIGIKCCTVDSICMEVEMCDTGIVGDPSPCINCDDLVEIFATPSDTSGNCCFNLSFDNNFTIANIGTISFTGIGGTQFALSTTSIGWTYSGAPSTTYREISALPIGVDTGYYADFLKLCLTGSSPSPHKILVKYKDVNGVCVCQDTLEFEQCKLLSNDCATISNDSMYCYNNKTFIQFYVNNNSAYPIKELIYNVIDPTKFTVTPYNTVLGSANAIPIGAVAGPFTVQIDTVNGGDAQFCLAISAFDSVHSTTSAPTTCCSDTIGTCLPFLHCVDASCCEFEHIIIPNGITPNADKINDTWNLIKPAQCDSIKITVFNRWGNKVYEDANYLNTWGGTNQSGVLLPQGTYFAIIELKNGSRKGLYIDIRY